METGKRPLDLNDYDGDEEVPLEISPRTYPDPVRNSKTSRPILRSIEQTFGEREIVFYKNGREEQTLILRNSLVTNISTIPDLFIMELSIMVCEPVDINELRMLEKDLVSFSFNNKRMEGLIREATVNVSPSFIPMIYGSNEYTIPGKTEIQLDLVCSLLGDS